MSVAGAQLISILFQVGSWITPISLVLRPLFYFLDVIIYTLIPIVYDFAINLTNIPLFINQDEVLNTVAKSIYSLLSVVMLFKLAFSLLTLMTDPDKIEDKEKGTAKIFTNVVVCMILIMAIPPIFRAGMNLQQKILEDKIIEKIFIKNDDGSCVGFRTNAFGGEETCTDLGTFISKSVFQVFIFPTPGAIFETEIATAYNTLFSGPNVTLFFLAPYIGMPTLQGLDVFGGVRIPLPIPVFALSYLYLLSTIAGGYILWMFVTLAIDIAYRSIKLFALQLISPIPIISYMDSNSQTKGIFKKWTEEVFKTYLSLFIRIATLSIVGLILMNIDWHASPYDSSMTDPTEVFNTVYGGWNPFVKLFFFLGMVTFMKTAPKMFENIFGFAGKTKEEGFGASLIKGLLGATTAGAVGAISGGISSKKNNLGFGIGALHGGLSGVTGGWKSGMNGKIGEFAKAVFGGPGAAAKALGYKGGVDILQQKMKHSAERGQMSKLYKGYQDRFAASTGEVSKLAEKMSKDYGYAGYGLSGGQKKILGKGIGKANAATGMFRSKDYENAYKNNERQKAMSKAFGSRYNELYAKVHDGSATTPERYQYQKMSAIKDKVEGDAKDTESILKQYQDNPNYQADLETNKLLDRALNEKSDIPETIKYADGTVEMRSQTNSSYLSSLVSDEIKNLDLGSPEDIPDVPHDPPRGTNTTARSSESIDADGRTYDKTDSGIFIPRNNNNNNNNGGNNTKL